jgi:2-C-methyl-D-erythritol 4-phosphate cytidylyltransferase
MEKEVNCCAIVVAAGSSTRMGLGFSKQLVPLNGVPSLIHTLSAFERSTRVVGVILVCRREEMPAFRNLIAEYRIRKITGIVPGGATRQQSVLSGISAAPRATEYFAIHDGARALITPDEIDAVVEDGTRFGASALAVPVKDTIKVADPEGFVASTPERSGLWAVQTPQVFERGLYLKAVERAQAAGADYTDDCQLVEHAGVKVHLCAGSYANLKLTTADDVPAAEAILKKREDSE